MNVKPDSFSSPLPSRASALHTGPCTHCGIWFHCVFSCLILFYSILLCIVRKSMDRSGRVVVSPAQRLLVWSTALVTMSKCLWGRYWTPKCSQNCVIDRWMDDSVKMLWEPQRQNSAIQAKAHWTYSFVAATLAICLPPTLMPIVVQHSFGHFGKGRCPFTRGHGQHGR